MSDGICLIVGLANPGDQYAQTRHNAGAWFIEKLCQQHNTELRPDKKLFGLSGRISVDGHDCRLLIPSTFMNDSGKAVTATANYYGLEPQQILVAHDELDLEPGDIRLKFSGGHGGHNGLRDIISPLTNNFYRLRIGIGKPPRQGVEHVLGKPSQTDRKAIDTAIDNAIDVLPKLLAGDINTATKTLHTRG